MTLEADFRVPDRAVAVSLSVPEGSITALVGPNGSGKSTVLNVLAGLVDADGSASLGGHELFNERRRVPAHQRRVALLAQQPLLFPRMTAAQNVEFSLRARKADRATALDYLGLVTAQHLARYRPGRLSGGQAQLVAIARALAAEPGLLLLDEPFSALDTSVAAELRHTLARVLQGRTALLVTHEVLDAALLADQLIVMDAGRIVESGPTEQVLSTPRTAFAAKLGGLNLLPGTAVANDVVTTEFGAFCGLGILTPGTAAVAAFPPAAVAVYTEAPHGSPRNVVAAHVSALAPQGQVVRVATDTFAADVTPAAVAALGLRPGVEVFLSVKASEVRLYGR
jgi:molybdate transport system ATP-binding protein